MFVSKTLPKSVSIIPVTYLSGTGNDGLVPQLS